MNYILPLDTVPNAVKIGFEISPAMICFFIGLIVSLILLLCLLVGLAGRGARERKYIKKATENNAKIPVRVTMPLPGTGSMISAEIKKRPSGKITADVQKTETDSEKTELMSHTEVMPQPSAASTASGSFTGIISQTEIKLSADIAKKDVAVGSDSLKKAGFAAPGSFDNDKNAVLNSNKVCVKCGSPVKGKFCAKCGTKVE